MREALALAALIYAVTYLLAETWARRRPARIVVMCPLRSETVPQEILERLGRPTRVAQLDGFSRAEFTIGYLTDAPGIAVATITDEASLDERLGPYLRRVTFAPDRDQCLACLRDRRWNADILYALALEVLHVRQPRSLLVDFRPPAADLAQARRISTRETDLDLGMYAYELLSRLRRYSRYRDATFLLLFCDTEGAWLFST